MRAAGERGEDHDSRSHRCRVSLRSPGTDLRALQDRYTAQTSWNSEARLHRELQHYATKADLKDTELRLGTEISGLKADLKDTELRLGAEISGLRADLKDTELRLRTEFSDLRTEFSDLRTELKVEIRESQMWLLLRLGGLIVAVVTIAAAVLKLLS